MLSPVEIERSDFEHELRPAGEGARVEVKIDGMIPDAILGVLHGANTTSMAACNQHMLVSFRFQISCFEGNVLS
jgi:hypothetical protein